MTFTPKHFTAWAEIPVTDLDAGAAFYAAATGGRVEKVAMGGDTVALFMTGEGGQSISANLFVGAPGPSDKGPVVFLNIDGTLEEASRRTEAAGGRVLSGIVAIPPGRYVHAADPDGNRFGLFEAA